MILNGDALETLRTLDAESVNCCVTSPPYWGLRDYGVDGQLGLDKTPEEYVARLAEIFREVRRVLRDDGTVWLNLGDSYAGGGRGGNPDDSPFQKQATNTGSLVAQSPIPTNLKPKDLVGIPWRVAFALQADGWWLRSDIIWSKPNPMPESVRDRPTRAHEYIFLLSKSKKYYYDHEAIKEPSVYGVPNAPDKIKSPYTGKGFTRRAKRDKQRGHSRRHAGFNDRWDQMSREEQGSMGRNKRDVWTVAAKPYTEAHFAVFPQELIRPCVLAGCPEGGTVLDPFFGAGTIGLVAKQEGREYIGIELNPIYVEMARARIRRECPMERLLV